MLVKYDNGIIYPLYLYINIYKVELGAMKDNYLTWKEVLTLPQCPAFNTHCAFVFGENLYLYGGLSNNPNETVIINLSFKLFFL